MSWRFWAMEHQHHRQWFHHLGQFNRVSRRSHSLDRRSFQNLDRRGCQLNRGREHRLIYFLGQFDGPGLGVYKLLAKHTARRKTMPSELPVVRQAVH